MRHIVSVSGGKDSTATYLRAIERGVPFRAVAADTGNEHPATYDHVNSLAKWTGGPEVEWVKADFSGRIMGKAKFVREHWPESLRAGKPGRWEFRPSALAKRTMKAALELGRVLSLDVAKPKMPPMPPEPVNLFGPWPSVLTPEGRWVRIPGRPPMSPDLADETVAVALEWLVPTGNPYLDLCIWKGRFPSRRAQFCTEELKISPIDEQVTRPALATGETIISWQGTRRGESFARSKLPALQLIGQQHLDLPGRLYAWRPLLHWSTEEVFAYTDRHGVPRNPLYGFGCRRVGCFPCINAAKDELALVDRVFPEQIDRLEAWEKRVQVVSKRGFTTFFNIVNDPVMQEELEYARMIGKDYVITPETHGIRRMVQWAKTARGGRQYDLFNEVVEPSACNVLGACE